MNIPNLMSGSRIFIAPFFMLFFLIDNPYAKLTSLLIVLFAEITDVLDGYIARKKGWKTELGKILDPLADSIFHFTVFLSFLVSGYADIWMVLIIFMRNGAISQIRWLAATKNRYISAKIIGKMKTMVQAIVIMAITSMATINYWLVVPYMAQISYVMMGLVTIITALSIIPYIRDNMDIICAELSDGRI